MNCCHGGHDETGTRRKVAEEYEFLNDPIEKGPNVHEQAFFYSSYPFLEEAPAALAGSAGSPLPGTQPCARQRPQPRPRRTALAPPAQTYSRRIDAPTP